MRAIKQIALSAILTLSAFCAVLYTSCSKDACKGVTCYNAGTCSGGTCTCPTGYEGANCQTLAIIGSWTGQDVCSSGGPYNVTLSVASSSADTTRVLITNPGGFGTNVQIIGVLSSDGRTVTYTNQTAGAVTLNGTISLSSNSAFTDSYTATDASSSVTCSGNYTKN
jgi:hypothetical protein